KITKLLEGKLDPNRRAVLISALARLKPDDAAALDKLHALLESDRATVRRATIETLSSIGTAASIDKLQARRGREEMVRLVTAIDEAVEAIRKRIAQPDALRKELEELRKQNQQLEERLKKLEKPA